MKMSVVVSLTLFGKRWCTTAYQHIIDQQPNGSQDGKTHKKESRKYLLSFPKHAKHRNKCSKIGVIALGQEKFRKTLLPFRPFRMMAGNIFNLLICLSGPCVARRPGGGGTHALMLLKGTTLVNNYLCAPDCLD